MGFEILCSVMKAQFAHTSWQGSFNDQDDHWTLFAQSEYRCSCANSVLAFHVINGHVTDMPLDTT